MANKLTFVNVQALINDQVKLLLDEIKALKDDNALLKNELQACKNEITQLKSDMNQQLTSLNAKLGELCGSIPIPNDSTASSNFVNASSFADTIRSSVQSAISNEKSKCDVVISGVDEDDSDEQYICELCNTMEFSTKPSEVTRLGKKREGTDRGRLLKVTFTSSFDARAFRSRFEVVKENKGLTSLRMRPSRNKEEQALFIQSKTLAHKLNNDAKAAKEDISYSVRDNGKLWQFKKQDDGKWLRNADWNAPGNECPAPKP